MTCMSHYRKDGDLTQTPNSERGRLSCLQTERHGRKQAARYADAPAYTVSRPTGGWARSPLELMWR